MNVGDVSKWARSAAKALPVIVGCTAGFFIRPTKDRWSPIEEFTRRRSGDYGGLEAAPKAAAESAVLSYLGITVPEISGSGNMEWHPENMVGGVCTIAGITVNRVLNLLGV